MSDLTQHPSWRKWYSVIALFAEIPTEQAAKILEKIAPDIFAAGYAARLAEIERLREALHHCINSIAEYERDNDESIRPFLLGSLDNARKTLSFANLNKNLYPGQIDNGDTDE